MDPLYDALAQSRTFKVFRETIEESADNLAAAPAPLALGEVLESKYKIEKLLGRGGMGAVYAATHVQLQKPVAVKALLAMVVDGEAFERFHREALSLGKFRHKHIVEVFDFGTLRDKPYFAMELLSGQSLAERMAESGLLAPAKVIEIFDQVADALEYAHRVEIVHRDIKPGNIFLHRSGTIDSVKLVDFGLAKLLSEGPATGQHGQSATQVGTIFGSPLYMSPEQSSGQLVDRRTDIYSFGCALFEALTGRPPFMEKTAIETIMAHQLKKAPRLKEAAPDKEFSARLEALIARTLKKNPADRFQSFTDVQGELKLIADSEAVKLRRDTSVTTVDNEEIKSFDGVRHKAFPLIPVAVSVLLIAGIMLLAAYFVHTSISAGKQKIAKATHEMIAEEKAIESKQASTAQQGEALPPEKVTIDVQAYAGVITLTFSPHRGNAYLYAPGSARNAKPIKCAGTVKLAAGHGFNLICEEAVSPEFLAAWPADSISALRLIKGDWTKAHFKALQKQTHLTRLFVRESEFLEGSALIMHQFHNLVLLDVTDSNIEGPQLAPLTSWPALIDLHACSLNNVMPALNYGAAPALKELHFDGNGVTDADLTTIAQKLPGLEVLSLNSNKITGNGLKALTRLKLRALDLEYTKIGPECIDSLSRIKSLKSLRMPKEGLSPADIQRLKQMLPANCWTITNLERPRPG